jgi:hypothetical protein
MTGEQQPGAFRESIAKWISISVISSTGVLGALGIMLASLYIAYQPGDEGLDRARDILQFIFSSLLPLWGTWIGTVLAYYFAKENFESANKQVRELVTQVTSATERLNTVRVTEVMMPFEKIKKVDVPVDKDPDTLVIDELYKTLTKDNVRRALIFKSRKIVYVLHKSLLSDFLFRNPGPAKSLTIKEMKADGDKDIQNAFTNGVCTVSKSATLLDVKNLMDNLAGCQDVFVTGNGKRDEEVLGWISNVDIMEKLKV